MKTISLAEFSPGWFSLSFSFDRSINALVKEIPGVRFVEQPRKMWIAPFHAIPALEMVGDATGAFDVKVTARLRGYNAQIFEGLLAPAKPYQREAAEKLAEHYGFMLAFDMRLGKCGKPDDRILTPTGWTTYGSVRVGDLVIGSDGKPTEVTGVFHRGLVPFSRVTFRDKTSVEVGDDHLWAVQTPNWRVRSPDKFVVKETRELAAEPLFDGAGNARWFIPMVKPVEFPAQDLPLHPYIVGVLLGDGHIESCTFTPGDELVPAEVEKLLPPDVKMTRYAGHPPTNPKFGLVGAARGRIAVAGLRGRSWEKFIPHAYLFGSVEQRVELLRGLIDTDGCVTDSNVEFTTTSERLAKDVRFLAQSLGGVATLAVKEVTPYTYKGERRFGRPAFRLSISLPFEVVPTRVKPWRMREKFSPSRAIISIESIGEREGICISVAAADHLYVVDHCIVTHNTLVSSVAASHALMSGRARTVLVFCPPGVVGEWQKQFPRWSLGLPIVAVEGTKPWNDQERSTLISAPWLALVCHYDLVKYRLDDLVAVLKTRGLFLAIADEAQSIQNVKAGRTKAVFSIIELPNCSGRVALTGTPMRNRPRDLYGPLHFILPGGVGSRSKFTARYADGHMGDYGWEDDGESNVEELAARLKACSMRLTRRDVAEWLPKSERNVILCDMDPQTAKAYAAQEQAQAPLIARALNGDASGAVQALIELARFTTASKIDSIVERVQHHLNRGAKVLIGSNFHETAQTVESALLKAQPNVMLRSAGGWKTPAQRSKAIEEWRAWKGPGVLVANYLSSGTGIDLSDAEVCLNTELTWVPADFMQWEARITDVHQGKRTTPPLYEYFLTRGTVDEDMAYKLLKKIGSIERVVGGDSESGHLAKTLKGSDLVERSNLSLNSVDPDDVRAAIDRMRDRIMGKRSATDLDKYERLKTAIDFTEAFSDDEEVTDDGA